MAEGRSDKKENKKSRHSRFNSCTIRKKLKYNIMIEDYAVLSKDRKTVRYWHNINRTMKELVIKSMKNGESLCIWNRDICVWQKIMSNGRMLKKVEVVVMPERDNVTINR